jgi:hypothetical protein
MLPLYLVLSPPSIVAMSSADFYLYQEAVSSPEVSCSLCGQFSCESPQLLVARRSLLQLYDLNRSLRLVAQCELQGVVRSMAVLVHSAYDYDLVLLAFEEAKIVTLQFDPSTNGFQTVALHSFEREDYSTKVTFNNLSIAVDPDNRCVMVQLPFNRLGIIPVKTGGKSQSSSEPDSCYLSLGKPVFTSSYTIDLGTCQIQQPQLITFARGFTEPTLVLISQEIPGLDLTSITWLSLNHKERKPQIVAKNTEVPPDVVHQIALKPPLTGQLLICSHSLVHYKEGQVFKHQLKADLENCAAVLFDPLKLVICTRTGELLLVVFNCFTEGDVSFLDEKLDTVKQVMQIKLPFNAQSIVSHIVAAGQYLWLGCTVHDSSLYRLALDESYSPIAPGDVRKVLNLQNVKVEKLDEIQTLATAVSAVLVASANPPELLIAHGYFKSSYISRVVLSALPSPKGHIEADSIGRIREVDRLLRIPGPNCDLYLLATSKSGFTLTLRTEDVIENVSEVTDFQSEYTTLLAGRLKGNLVYQVTNVCIRVMTDKGKLVKEYPKTWTVQAASYKRYFSLLLADGSIETTKIDVNAGFSEVAMPSIPIEPEIMSIDITAIQSIPKQKVLILARADSSLQIYDVLTGSLMVTYMDAAYGPALLSEDSNSEWVAVTDQTQKVPPVEIAALPVYIREIVLRQVGDMIVLLLRTDKSQIYIYQHYGDHLFYRFSRLQSGIFMGEIETPEEPIQSLFHVPLTKLQSAFFVLHPRQCFWVIPDIRHRVLRFHCGPRQVPKAFSPFNYVDSEDGFVHLDNDQLVITRLDDDLTFTMAGEALAIRLPFLDTPRQLVLHQDTVFASFFTEDEKGLLYSLRSFTLTRDRGLTEVCNIPRFSQNEIITDMAVINFRRKVESPNLYLAIATAVSGGEDVECTGRLFLCAIQNRTLVPVKLEYRPTLIGAVTAVAELDGYLLAAVSFEVKMFTYVEELEPYMEEIAFFRSPYLCIHFDVYQNFALCLDVRKSGYVLGYREAHNQRELLQLGAFEKEHNSLSGAFMLLKYAESEELGVRAVICDDLENLYILHTVPWTETLEKVGELHTGFSVFSIAHCNGGLLLCAKEGVIAWITPLSGYLFRKMHTLQTAMLEALPSKAGLNGRGFRHPIMHDRERQKSQSDQGGAVGRVGSRGVERERLRKTVLDRNQVLSFSYLSSKLQHALSRNVGSSPSVILPEISQLSTLQDFL